MNSSTSRRQFLRQTSTATLALGACAFLPNHARAALPFPLVDCHVHLDNSTVEQVLELSKQRGIKFGIVEHAGTKENKYPVVLSNDEELLRYISMLEGKPVYKGIQAEWIDWRGCFSSAVLGKLDFILTDAMTMHGPNGSRMKLWEPGAVLGQPDHFMDRYVEWHEEILATQPIDILGNTTWTPDALMPEYDRLWTTKRMERVIAAAVKYNVALEISSSYKLPRLPFLRLAKEAGVKFSFGSNGRYPKMGLLDYSVEMATALKLSVRDMFQPATPGKRAVERRRA